MKNLKKMGGDQNPGKLKGIGPSVDVLL